MITITSSNDFENIVHNMEASNSKIASIFEETTASIAKLNTENSWEGIAQKQFISKYESLQSNYEIINNSMLKNVNFLKNIIESYKETENQINKNIDSNSLELNVNS